MTVYIYFEIIIDPKIFSTCINPNIRTLGFKKSIFY